MRKLNRTLLVAIALTTNIGLFGVSCGDAAPPDGSGGEPSTGGRETGGSDPGTGGRTNTGGHGSGTGGRTGTGGGGGGDCWECPFGCAAGCLDPAFGSCQEMMDALCGAGGAGGEGGLGGLGGLGGDEN